jgi:hypothetical protein
LAAVWVIIWEEAFMAKVEMVCPFSGTLCKDCPVYRGRHFYLCFCENYRGSLPGVVKNMPMAKKSNGQWEMPSLPNKKDPYFDEML